MGILDSIVNGVKGFMSNNGGNPKILMNGQPITQVDPTMYGGVSNAANPPAQNPSNLVVTGANQGGAAANVNAQPQPQTNGANKIVNAIKNSQLRPSNWSDGTRQTVSNILFGIGRNALQNPNGDVLTNLLGGVNSGIQNQIAFKNAVNTMKQNGVDPSGLSPYADYTGLTWDKIQDIGIKQQQNQIRQQQNQIRQDIANANDNTKRLNLIMTALKNNTITPEEAQTQAKLYGLDVGTMQASNETNRTNSQIQLNEQRGKAIEASIRQNDQKIAILKQKVAQGNANQSDKQLLNKLNIENKQLIIEQNRLINEGLREQLGGGGNGNGGINTGGRPVGQRGNVKVF